MEKLLATFTLVLATTTACGGSTGTNNATSPTNATGSANASISGLPSTNPSASPDPTLVSQVDPSPTIRAINSGLNPLNTFIPGAFFCYREDSTNLATPATVLNAEGNLVTITNGGQAFTVTSRPGPSDNQVALVSEGVELLVFDVDFTEFGQELVSDNSPRTFCYQDGAAHIAAQHRFTLNTPPDTGRFSCRASNSSNSSPGTSIELLSGNRYQADGQVGSYSVEGAILDFSSSLTFLSGTLAGLTAEYSENPDTGLQLIRLSQSSSEFFINGSAVSSSSISSECKNLSEPKPFKRFGPGSAPQPTTPAQSIQGAYFINSSTLTTETRLDRADYVEFKSNGYFYSGKPVPGGVNCTFSRPNGMPFCDQYQFDGQVLSLIQPWGQVLPIPSSARNETLQTFNDFPAELLTPVVAANVEGTWVSQDVRSSSVASCTVGVCFSSITNRSFHFRIDGQYLFTIGSESSDTFNAGELTSFSTSSGEDQGTGTYAISGNTIELRSQDGQIETLPVYLTRSGDLAIGEFLYSR